MSLLRDSVPPWPVEVKGLQNALPMYGSMRPK